MKLRALTESLALTALVPAHAALTNKLLANVDPVSLVDFEAFDGLITTSPERVAPNLIFTGDTGS